MNAPVAPPAPAFPVTVKSEGEGYGPPHTSTTTTDDNNMKNNIETNVSIPAITDARQENAAVGPVFQPPEQDDMTVVEVVLGANANIWHLAKVLDVHLPTDDQEQASSSASGDQGGATTEASGSITVGFQDGIWEPLEVPSLRVRRSTHPYPLLPSKSQTPSRSQHSPASSGWSPSSLVDGEREEQNNEPLWSHMASNSTPSGRNFSPNAGSLVEAFIPAGDEEPAYWTLARMLEPPQEVPSTHKEEKGATMKVYPSVEFLLSSGKASIGSFEQFYIREPNKNPSVCLFDCLRRRVALPLHLTSQKWVGEEEALLTTQPNGTVGDATKNSSDSPWIDTIQAFRTLCKIRHQSGALHISLLRNRNPVELEFVGTCSETVRAENLLQQEFQFLKNQFEFHERRERRLKLLEERKSKYEGTEHVEFEQSDDTLVGLIIGKQGENLSRVARLFKVEIRVLPDDDGIRRVRVYGSNLQNAQRAVEELNYVYHDFSVTMDLARWADARRGANLREFVSRTELQSAWLNSTKSQLQLCGLKRTMGRARNILSFLIHNTNAMALPFEQFWAMNEARFRDGIDLGSILPPPGLDGGAANSMNSRPADWLQNLQRERALTASIAIPKNWPTAAPPQPSTYNGMEFPPNFMAPPRPPPMMRDIRGTPPAVNFSAPAPPYWTLQQRNETNMLKHVFPRVSEGQLKDLQPMFGRGGEQPPGAWHVDRLNMMKNTPQQPIPYKLNPNGPHLSVFPNHVSPPSTLGQRIQFVQNHDSHYQQDHFFANHAEWAHQT